MTTTRTIYAGRHTGYTVTNDDGAVVASVTESRRTNGGYSVQLYVSPDEYTRYHMCSLSAARDLAESHALTF